MPYAVCGVGGACRPTRAKAAIRACVPWITPVRSLPLRSRSPAMASPLSDPLSCDELTLDWDTEVERGAAGSFAGRGVSPAPRCRDDDSDGEGGCVSEDEEPGSDAYWQEQLQRQASLQPVADYPEWHPVVNAVDRVVLVEWIGRVRGPCSARGRRRGPRCGALTRCGRVADLPAAWLAAQDARAGRLAAGPLRVAGPHGGACGAPARGGARCCARARFGRRTPSC